MVIGGAGVIGGAVVITVIHLWSRHGMGLWRGRGLGGVTSLYGGRAWAGTSY